MRVQATFETEAQAWDWLYERADNDCVDNTRLAYADRAQVRAYNAQASEGCCGCIDKKVMIAGRLAWIGCNFGH
jgi:hypothetical protein